MTPTTSFSPGDQTVLSCGQVLDLAHEDAARAYRDLSPYRIEIALEADGWHIDFELRDTKMHGGGPHYVIDPVTGAMLSKRYEQ